MIIVQHCSHSKQIPSSRNICNIFLVDRFSDCISSLSNLCYPGCQRFFHARRGDNEGYTRIQAGRRRAGRTSGTLLWLLLFISPKAISLASFCWGTRHWRVYTRLHRHVNSPRVYYCISFYNIAGILSLTSINSTCRVIRLDINRPIKTPILS